MGLPGLTRGQADKRFVKRPPAGTLADAVAPRVLARSESTLSDTASSTTASSVPGMDLTITVADRDVEVEAKIGYCTSSASGATTLVLRLQDVTNGVELGRIVRDFTAASQSDWAPGVKAILPAGYGTCRVQLQKLLASGTNGVTLQNGTSKSRMIAREI